MKKIGVFLILIIILFIAYKLYIVGWILFKILIGLGILILIGLGGALGYFIGRKLK